MQDSAPGEKAAAGDTRRIGVPTADPGERSSAAPPASELPPGSLVGGRYRLERRLNAGGMGTVHLAQPIGGNQKVVVKLPHAHLASSPDFIERFSYEVRALQKLTHPHVVEIYDAGTDRVREAGVERGVPYLVVRYMSGGSLKDRIAQAGGRLLPTQLGWLRPIADALDFIHSQNVVHLDVKPENLLFDVHGTVYLTDFGIAKLSGADSELDFDGILGSPSYMAPEYATRSRATESDQYRMDQYSLAVVVYEALCGALPHTGDSVEALLASKSENPPEPILDRLPELPKPLAAAIMRGLAHEPLDRFDSCGELADAVLAAVRAPRRRAGWPFALALAAVVAGASGYAYIRTRPAPLTMQVASVHERLLELAAHELGTHELLSELAGEAGAINALMAELALSDAPRRDAYGVATSASSLALREVERSLGEIEILRSHADEEARSLASLRDRATTLQARAAVLRGRIDAQRADLRAHGEQIFQVRLQVARLLDLTARSRAPDPRIVELEREISGLEAQRAADAAVLDLTSSRLEAASTRLISILARLETDEHSLENETRKLDRAQVALLARRTELTRREP